MANDHTIKNYSATDIERYHRGLLSPKEMHELEKAALDDPFLADALEGYNTPGVNAAQDIAELKRRLAGVTEEQTAIPLIPSTRQNFSWWKIAAMIILVAGAGLFTYQFAFKSKRQDIAQSKPAAVPNTVTADSAIDKGLVNVAPGTMASDSGLEYKFSTNDSLKKEVASPTDLNATLNQVGSAAAADSINSSQGYAKAKKDLAPGKPAPISGNAEVQADDEPKRKLANDAITEKNFSKAEPPVIRQDSISLQEANTVLRGRVAGVMANKARNNEAYRNNHIFRGKVTDAQNNALPFANITNPVDNVGTYTDASGFFTLTSPDSVLNVQVRSLGFENNAVALRDNLNDNRVLMQEDRSLNARILDTVKRNANRVRNSNMKFEEPEPEDGWKNYDTYLVNNLNVPENFKSRQTGTGEVQLSFEVNKLGEPVNIRVEKSLCETCDKEAIRLVKEGPKWKRKARKNRTTVTVSF